KFTRDLTDPSERTIPTIGPDGLFTGRSMPLQQAVSELLSPTEYGKWLSAVETTAYDFPHITFPIDDEGNTNDNVYDGLHLLGAALGEGDWTGGVPLSCTTKFCNWYRRPTVYRPDGIKYWEVSNKPSIPYTAQQVLSSDEYARWRQRLEMRPADIYLDPGLEDVAIQLLESNWPSTIGSGYRTEQGDWFNEAQHCWFDVEPGQTPYQHCPNRYLAAKPEHSGSAYL